MPSVPTLAVGWGNVRQCFQHNRRACVFSIGHQAFGNAMVDVALEPGLLLSHTFQPPLGRLGSRALIGLSGSTTTFALPLDSFTTIGYVHRSPWQY